MRTLLDSLEDIAHHAGMIHDTALSVRDSEKLCLLAQARASAAEESMRGRIKKIIELLDSLPRPSEGPP